MKNFLALNAVFSINSRKPCEHTWQIVISSLNVHFVPRIWMVASYLPVTLKHIDQDIVANYFDRLVVTYKPPVIFAVFYIWVFTYYCSIIYFFHTKNYCFFFFQDHLILLFFFLPFYSNFFFLHWTVVWWYIVVGKIHFLITHVPLVSNLICIQLISILRFN